MAGFSECRAELLVQVSGWLADRKLLSPLQCDRDARIFDKIFQLCVQLDEVALTTLAC